METQKGEGGRQDEGLKNTYWVQHGLLGWWGALKSDNLPLYNTSMKQKSIEIKKFERNLTLWSL